MNPYEKLGVHPIAAHADIKAAYRRLAKVFHPDVNPGDPEAEVRFKEISAAYGLVGAPEARARHDRASPQHVVRSGWPSTDDIVREAQERARARAAGPPETPKWSWDLVDWGGGADSDLGAGASGVASFSVHQRSRGRWAVHVSIPAGLARVAGLGSGDGCRVAESDGWIAITPDPSSRVRLRARADQSPDRLRVETTTRASGLPEARRPVTACHAIADEEGVYIALYEAPDAEAAADGAADA